MKRIFIFLFLIPVLGIAQPATDGLVGYWPFNGNANDESGNGNGGVVNGATLATDRFGNVNSAYSFDGSDDYINFNSIVNDLTSTASGTWSVWLNPTDATPSGDNDYPFTFGDTDADNAILIGVLQSGKARFQIKINGQHKFILDTDNVVFSDNAWTHIAVVQTGIEPILYINGNAIPQSFITSNDKTTWFSDLIGIDNSRVGRLTKNNGVYGQFEGLIDDIRVYNRALTEAEIQNLYTNETTPPINHLCDNFYCDGTRVGIGTTTVPAEYVLAVNGKAIVEEIKVQLNENWPDYVFDEQYHLKDLTHLENYIKTNKHLPNIPKAEDVEKDGYELSEMDSKLLEKIEELTLYIIEQNKKIIELEKRLEEVENN